MSSKKPISSKKEGSIDVNGEYLNYAILQGDQFVIVQSSLYFYLEINIKNKETISFPTDYDHLILFTSISGEPEIGVPITDFVNYSVSLIGLMGGRDSKGYRKAFNLISFLTTGGLMLLIHEENLKPIVEEEKPEPSFDDLIEGLLRVPPPAKKKN